MYRALLAQNESERAAAERLRHRLFKCSSETDLDAWDAVSEHVLLLHEGAHTKIVGTCRVIVQEALRPKDSFYAASEYALDALPPDILPHCVELGRLAMDESHRSLDAVLCLWRAVGSIVSAREKRYLIGCASLPVVDAGSQSAVSLAALMNKLALSGAMHPDFRVRALALPPDHAPRTVTLPPLVRMYLAAGAKVIGEPAYDGALRVWDLLALLDTETMPESYRARFFASTTVR